VAVKAFIDGIAGLIWNNLPFIFGFLSTPIVHLQIENEGWYCTPVMYLICGCLQAYYTEKGPLSNQYLSYTKRLCLYYQHYLDTSLLILRQFSTIKSVISHIDQVYNGKNLKRARMLTFRNLNLVQVPRFSFLLSVTKIEIVCFKKAEIHKLNKLT